MSAFVVIGSVVLIVAGWVAWLSHEHASARPALARETLGTKPSYAIVDSRERVLASFVPRFDLELSPRSMWQAHTPALIAARISDVLGGEYSPEELLSLFFPDAVDGVIHADAWELSARQANLLMQWLEGGTEGGAAIDGIWVENLRGGRTWHLAWRPETVLAREQREAHGYTSAWSWGRYLANGIAACLRDPSLPPPRGTADREGIRAAVWSALIPRAFCRPLEGLPFERVLALRELLVSEGVSPWQMRVAFGRDRVYPTGEHELFGSWGFVSAEQTEAAPREGLELLCDRLLSQPEWEERLTWNPAVYRWLQDRNVGGDRANGYLDYEPPSTPPIVESTLDLALQDFVGEELDRVVEEHRPALAMAMVVDVDSGDVLAVESRELHELQPFAPIYHVFTTGSTFKVLTMACALEEGVVRPTEVLDVGQGEYRIVYPDGRPSGRRIHEAEGALTGKIEARDAFAFSVNAGMTQIGLRMDDDAFHGYLERLRYGQAPESGLGIERAGNLTPLPWKYAYTHASVCFGHEISTTVWQHVAALATVVRGGILRPLRIIRAVEQGARRWELPPGGGERIFSESTCAEVRDLMRFGALAGTGRELREAIFEKARVALAATGESASELDSPDALDALIDLGTKTGTAEKVASELCVHVEMEARRRWKEQGLRATQERYRELSSLPKPHPSCYTSSIAMFGSRADRERELMVFVVVEEPRGKQKFGAKVAGPAAANIMSEALGLMHNGLTPRPELADGFYASDTTAQSELDEPWRVEDTAW